MGLGDSSEGTELELPWQKSFRNSYKGQLYNTVNIINAPEFS